jgi:hypothetical protein
MCDMEDERQKYQDAFRAAGWELFEDQDETAPNKVSGRYKVPGYEQREFVISFDPDGPYDYRGNIAMHDGFSGAFTITNRILTPEDAVEAFKYDH